MKSLCYFFHHGLRPPSTAGTLQAKRDLTRKEMERRGGKHRGRRTRGRRIRGAEDQDGEDGEAAVTAGSPASADWARDTGEWPLAARSSDGTNSV
ncbi:unnamed protein product [Prorocentrum cordatum]|uniref:Uncharacterized protein n=1 Tax=Prorocentrum cordatum TaxID=2364126 RepID=A0ABN9Q9V4_9DINO|nr:unnamed protein product [Polarella glacialis]